MKFEPVVGELRRGNIVAKGKPWHSMSIDEVFRALSTTAEGLSDVEAKSRLEKYGFNELVERARVSPIRLFIDQFKNFLVALLIVASIISAAIGAVSYTHLTLPTICSV